MRALVLVCFCLAFVLGAAKQGGYSCIVESPRAAIPSCLNARHPVTDLRTGVMYCCASGLYLHIVNGRLRMPCRCHRL
ncbi:hypothetical protein PoB_003360100 [Plakobranchus ocellatus]|uniref:Secreted protein n=1 Tax=Plakobranchus ocellatus TaxID=259542 RepID=A0AAV4AKH9_9GAST|nr:hypothetical protein PoB_003360100 [Plakobranchus ocellatus]